MRVRVRVEDEAGVLVRHYGPIEWRHLEPLLRRLDAAVELAGRVSDTAALITDLQDVVNGRRPRRRRRIAK